MRNSRDRPVPNVRQNQMECVLVKMKAAIIHHAQEKMRHDEKTPLDLLNADFQ